MFKYLLLLFIIVPLLELYVLIEVGRGIGGFLTVLLCLFTAAVGGLLIRLQGLLTLLDAQRRLAKGEIPATHVFHALMLVGSGLLLFLPGLITDFVGFLLLVPSVREVIIRQISGRVAKTKADKKDIIEAEVIEVYPSPPHKIKRD
ncbi:MAG: FxsA family protein [Mariprofundaceae bacterium]|nr:FxsA family protein [Mariprofundaceae bacterium]